MGENDPSIDFEIFGFYLPIYFLWFWVGNFEDQFLKKTIPEKTLKASLSV